MIVFISQGMVLTAQREQPLGLKFINAAIPHIFDNATSVFVTAPAKDLLFNGILFNCTSSDFSTKAVCSELKKRAHNFHRISEDIYKFSIFGSVRLKKTRDTLLFKLLLAYADQIHRLIDHTFRVLQNYVSSTGKSWFQTKWNFNKLLHFSRKTPYDQQKYA